MLKGRGRVIIQGKGGYTQKCFIYIPTGVARDSQFPFKESQYAEISVNPETGEITIRPYRQD